MSRRDFYTFNPKDNTFNTERYTCHSIEEVDQIARRPMSIPISCYQKLNLDGLLVRLWDEMELVRVYTKKVGKKPDFEEPVVLTPDRGGVDIGR